jgi:hypothetical protein
VVIGIGILSSLVQTPTDIAFIIVALSGTFAEGNPERSCALVIFTSKADTYPSTSV